MIRRYQKSMFAAVMAAAQCVFSVSSAFAQDMMIVANNVGYEKTGPKRAIVMSATASTVGTIQTADIINAGGEVVHTTGYAPASAVGSAQWNVDGYRYFAVVDFSDFDQVGDGYKIRIGTAESPAFSIGEKILQTVTGADQVNFFYQMRHGYHTSDAEFGREGGTTITAATRAAYEALDSNIPIFGSSGTRNLRGGWWDATGDGGKHLSHLAYSNYFTPQQIPFVVWALLHAHEAQPQAFGDAAKSEAAWGADYLLRALSPENYFYMSIFDNWGAGYMHTPITDQTGTSGAREICAWGSWASLIDEDPPGSGNPNSRGFRSADYQSALREGGGVSIAALARAYKVGISGDSTAAQYLAGAKRAYEHLMEPENYTKYQDDNVLNIIDFYAALLAATELYNATNESYYSAEASRWVDSLLSLQSPDGWFYSGNDAKGRARPFYHAAEEGFPVVALSRFYQVAASPAEKLKLREAVGKNLRWYNRITYNEQYGPNPFEYARMWRTRNTPQDGPGGPVDLARGGIATASREEESFVAANAFDGSSTTRWSSYENGAENDSQWVAVDLGGTYKINRVVLRWERSFGKNYRIEVSGNGTDWSTALEVSNNTVYDTRLEHTFPAVDARHVRMYGVERDYEWGGFSLYDFEVYGEEKDDEPPSDYQAAFFIPKQNETGYWWQGENARLASMASAFILGAPIADHTGGMWDTTLFKMATSQLDWILGRNPFDLTMMYGYGRTTYDHFPAAFYLNNIKGGICNGISSNPTNENNVAWRHWNDWMDWRFMEQWLPHNAWYLVAISSLSYRIDNPIEPEEVSVRHSAPVRSQRMRISAARRNLRIELPFAADQNTNIVIYNMRGRKVHSHAVSPGLRTVSLRIPAQIARGTYIVSVRDMSGKNKISDKIVLR